MQTRTLIAAIAAVALAMPLAPPHAAEPGASVAATTSSRRFGTRAPRDVLDDMEWIAGTWRGDGFETTYTRPEGGLLLSVSRYFKDGRAVFFELEHFAANDTAVVLTPYPDGKPSKDLFPLVAYDPAAQRATFENLAHDYPKRLTYHAVGDDSLHIDLEGDENGRHREEHFRLVRAR